MTYSDSTLKGQFRSSNRLRSIEEGSHGRKLWNPRKWLAGALLLSFAVSFTSRKQSLGATVAGIVATAMLLVGAEASMVSTSSPAVVRTLKALAWASTFTMTSADIMLGSYVNVQPSLDSNYQDKNSVMDGVFDSYHESHLFCAGSELTNDAWITITV